MDGGRIVEGYVFGSELESSKAARMVVRSKGDLVGLMLGDEATEVDENWD